MQKGNHMTDKADFVTQQECEDRRDKVETLITQEQLRTTVMETKMNDLLWLLRAIAVAVIGQAVAYVYSIVR